MEGGYLGLAPLELHHPLLSRQALGELVHSHYMRAALPGLIAMLGSSNVLGKYLKRLHTACDCELLWGLPLKDALR